MFHFYKPSLKKHSSTNITWDVAHAHGINSVTPKIARSSYFWHCGIPLCDHFPSIDWIEIPKHYADLIEMIGVDTTDNCIFYESAKVRLHNERPSATREKDPKYVDRN